MPSLRTVSSRNLTPSVVSRTATADRARIGPTTSSSTATTISAADTCGRSRSQRVSRTCSGYSTTASTAAMNSASASGQATKPTSSSVPTSSTNRKRRAARSSRDIRGLLRLFLETDSGHHLAPLGLFGREEGGVVLRRAAGGDAADLRILFFQAGRLKRGGCRGMQPLLHVGGGGRRHHQAIPVVRGDVGQL